MGGQEIDTGRKPLTGVWNGMYSYPALLDPVCFVATLIDAGVTFSGSIHETCDTGEGVQATLLALLSGSCAGHSVTFAKDYDGSGGWTHTVHYEGTLSSDGTEIEGRWHVPGAMSGKFLMIRNTSKARALTREVFEKV